MTVDRGMKFDTKYNARQRRREIIGKSVEDNRRNETFVLAILFQVSIYHNVLSLLPFAIFMVVNF